MSLIRLAYASRASFRPSGNASGVEPEVGRILMTSLRNNPRAGIVGGSITGMGISFSIWREKARRCVVFTAGSPGIHAIMK